MLLISLLSVPLIGIFIISSLSYGKEENNYSTLLQIKTIAHFTSALNIAFVDVTDAEHTMHPM